jgi:hypothetical protein
VNESDAVRKTRICCSRFTGSNAREDLQQVTGLARVVAAVQMHGREQVLAVHDAVLTGRELRATGS